MSEPSRPTPSPSRDGRLSTPFAGEGGKDPMPAARARLGQARVKLFYGAVAAREVEGARHALALDGRVARTPGRNALSAPSQPLMMRVKAEWERQRETIDPADM